MPLWNIYHPEGTFEDNASKESLSKDITAIYHDGPAALPKFYVIVNFIKLPQNSTYIGGIPNTGTPFIRLKIDHIAVTLPNVCKNPDGEKLDRPRIKVDTHFSPPCKQPVSLTAPVGRSRPGDRVEVYQPSIKLKRCPAAKMEYKKLDVPFPKPCPKVAPVNIDQNKCTVKLPKVILRDKDSNVKLDTKSFQMPCPEIKFENADIALPVITNKPAQVCIELSEFCPPKSGPDCPPRYVPC
jgi:hypothetical protein